jgi:hypothetical protein
MRGLVQQTYLLNIPTRRKQTQYAQENKMAKDCNFTLFTKHSLQGVCEHSAVRAVAESSGNLQTFSFSVS